ncbi:MAG: hypothetical protein WD357_05600 [Gracilimonas sp.]
MKRNIIFGLLIFSMGVFFSCGETSTDSNSNEQDPEDPITEETTVAEDKINIENSLDNTIALLRDLENGKFLSTLETFVGASSGEFSSDDWVEDVFAGLEDFVDTQSIEDNYRFDFNTHSGVYVYNISNENWSKASSSNNIVLEFPSSENKSSNDLTLTISDFSDVSVNLEGESYYLPNKIDILVEQDGEAIFHFDLNKLLYSNDPDLPLPTAIDLSLMMSPFTHTVSYSKNSSTNYALDIGVLNGEDVVTGFQLEVELAHDNYDNLEEEDIEKIKGLIKLTSDLTVQFDIDSGTLFSLNDPSENQINSLVTAEVLFKEVLIGELEYSEVEEDIMIVYKDGSSESSSRYYEDFLDQLETVFYSFTGDWIDF